MKNNKNNTIVRGILVATIVIATAVMFVALNTISDNSKIFPSFYTSRTNPEATLSSQEEYYLLIQKYEEMCEKWAKVGTIADHSDCVAPELDS